MIPLSRFNFSLPPRPLYDFLGAASQRYLFTLGFVAAFFIEAFTRSEKSTPAFRVAVGCAGGIVAQAVAYYFKSSSEFKLYTGCKNLLGIAKNGTRDQALQKADQLLGNFRNQAGSTYYQCLVRVKQELEKMPQVPLKEYLAQRIVGQPDAIEAVANAMLSHSMGLSDLRRPIGVFLFLGPTGVGKTELAKALGEFLFCDSRLIRLDMSHFQHSADTSRLIGSSPGYVGHSEGGQLTNPLLSTPHSVVLLDEIEKARPEIRQFFLPVFDEASIKDSRGRVACCNQAVFIMTSNLFSTAIRRLFAERKTPAEILVTLQPHLMDALSPEFYARVVPILFRPLDDSMVDRLVDNFLEPVIQKVRSSRNIEVVIDRAVKEYLKRNSDTASLGARSLNSLIEREIKPGLAAVLSSTTEDSSVKTIRIFYAGGKLSFQAI